MSCVVRAWQSLLLIISQLGRRVFAPCTGRCHFRFIACLRSWSKSRLVGAGPPPVTVDISSSSSSSPSETRWKQSFSDLASWVGGTRKFTKSSSVSKLEYSGPSLKRHSLGSQVSVSTWTPRHKLSGNFFIGIKCLLIC